jgi:hypothetical protein
MPVIQALAADCQWHQAPRSDASCFDAMIMPCFPDLTLPVAALKIQ